MRRRVRDIHGMEILKTLAVALSLGTLAGINLYLTVFVTGMALRFDWVVLPATLQGLEVLSHPLVIGVSGILYLVEFFADKVPWVDTAWDAVHTFIRPVGAAALAVTAMGEGHPVFEIVAGLLAGSMALSAHAAKAGSRLAANASPEPFSNIGLSLLEDGIVLGGLGLIVWNPFVSLLLAAVFCIVVLAVLPRLCRAIRTHLWFAWKKLNCPPDEKKPPSPAEALPRYWEGLLRQSHSSKSGIEWCAPCVSGKGAIVRPNITGWLVGLSDKPVEIYFIGHTWRGLTFAAMDIRKAPVEFHAGFMAGKLEVGHRDGAPRQTFFFEPFWSKAAEELARRLRDDAGTVTEG